MEEKCPVTPGGKCDIRDDVLALKSKFSDFQQQNASTHERFGERIGELEARAKVQDVEVKSLQKSIDDMGDDVKEVMAEAKEMDKQMPVIVTKLDAISESSKAVDADVDELKEKPGKRWDSVVGQVIGLVVAALVGFLLSRLGVSG